MSENKELILEIGKRYVRRDGLISGAVVENDDDGKHLFPYRTMTIEDLFGVSYTREGNFFFKGARHNADLIEEYIGNDPKTKEDPGYSIVDSEITKNPRPFNPPLSDMGMRDHFALHLLQVSIPGLMSQAPVMAGEALADWAYDLADALLERRKRGPR